MTAITRVRRSRGTPWRKTEFQTCEVRTPSRGAVRRRIGFYFGFRITDFGLKRRPALGPASIRNPKSKIQNPFLAQRDKALRIIPLAQFLAEDPAHVDDDVPFGIFGDCEPLERP